MDIEMDTGLTTGSRARGARSGLRNIIGAVTGRSFRPRTRAERRSDIFKTLVALMLAVVTIASALIAWRSSLAGNLAGNTEDNGLIAAINVVESSTTANLQANEHLAAHLAYRRYLKNALTMVSDFNKTFDPNTTSQAETQQVLRQTTEDVDMAITDKRFFLDPRYLDRDDNYHADQEIAEYMAEQAQQVDLDPDRSFVEADKWRATSVAWVATLIIMGVALWCFAVAETLSSAIKFAMATGGMLFFAVGSGVGIALELGQPLDSIQLGGMYDLSFLLCWIAGIVTLVAAAAMGILVLVQRSREKQRLRLAAQPAAVAYAYPAPYGYGGPQSQYQGAQAGYPYGPPSTPVQPPVERSADEKREEATEAGDEGDTPGEARFKEVVTILIATVALFGGLVAWLQADAGARGDNAIRDTQRYAAEALGKQAVGEAQVSYQYGTAARNWKEIDILVESADKAKDSTAAARYKSVQDEVASLAEILGKPYFDAANHTIDNVPDVSAYQADKYIVDKTLLSERSSIEGNLNNAWESKSNNYTIHLTLLAAALALFGLSMALSGLVRPIFAGVALLLTVVTGGAVYGTFVERISSTPLEAVQAYAQGVGDAYKYDSAAAVDKFTEALKADPTYADALYERGNAYYSLGKYEDAARDFQASMGAGRDDTSVTWNLGWTFYILGRFDDAITVDQQALQVNPTLAGPRLNLALAYLASGQRDKSEAEYNRAIDDVVQLVADAKQSGKTVAPSLWFYIDAGARDLESLYDKLNDKTEYWEEAPPKESIADPFTAQAEAEKKFFKLKSLTVALEYTGKPPAEEPKASIGEFQFGTKASDSDPLKVATTFPSSSKDIYVAFDYSGMKNGQKIVYKVYVDGNEYPEFRVATDWDKGEKGHAEVTFSEDIALSASYGYYSGKYVVEMYVDSHLMQRGTFTVESNQP